MRKLSPAKLWIRKLMTWWLPETRFFGFKVSTLRWCGAKVGNNVRIASSAVFLGDGSLEIGDDVFIGSEDHISPCGSACVKIGSHVDIAPGVMILTGSHQIDPEGEHIGGKGLSSSVEIGDGCWLGARSVILPGITIGPKTIVASGAVVSKSNDTPRSLLAGVPAVCKKMY